MAEGWICLHRGLLDWEWYDQPETFRLFIHCLLKANFKDKTWQGIEIKRGSFISSYPKLSAETGLSVKQIRNSIARLRGTGEMAHQSTSQHSVFTVLSYEKYQDGADQRAGKGQAKGRRGAATNKENKENKEYIAIWFEKFWNAGMRKTNKKKSLPIFTKLVSEFESAEVFAVMLANDIQKRIAANQFGFDALHPATYLNNRRWEDEITANESEKDKSGNVYTMESFIK